MKIIITTHFEHGHIEAILEREGLTMREAKAHVAAEYEKGKAGDMAAIFKILGAVKEVKGKKVQ